MYSGNSKARLNIFARVGIILFLMLALIISASSCNKKPPDENDTDSKASEATDPAKSESESEKDDSEPSGSGTLTINAENASEYTLIRDDLANDTLKSAITGLRTLFTKKGFEIGYQSDYAKSDADIPTNTKEILVGKTNRAESIEFAKKLKKNDYVIAVKNSRIIILGGSEESTLKAIEYFENKYLYTKDSSISLEAKDSIVFSYSYQYKISELTFNGTPISEFTIVRPTVSNALSNYAADVLKNAIAEYSGVELSIVTEKKATDGKNIYIKLDTVDMADSDKYYYTDNEIHGSLYSIVYAVRQITAGFANASDGKYNIEMNGNGGKLTMKKNSYPTEPTLAGKIPVALCDQKNAEAVIIDLAAKDPTSAEAIIWRWSPNSSANGFSGSGFKNSIDEIKLRYSSVLEKYVVCITSSAGFMGVAEYPSGKKIWEASASGMGPHSIEYLPNGMIACALSGNTDYNKACVKIYDSNKSSPVAVASESLYGAHGVVWDNELGVLWALSNYEIVAYDIGSDPDAPTLTLINGLGGKLPGAGGHDLSTVAESPDKLWVSSNSVYMFDKYTGKFIDAYDGKSQIAAYNVKCISSTENGTVLRTVATEVYKAHDTDTLTVFVKNESGSYTETNYVFADRAFYKARYFYPY